MKNWKIKRFGYASRAWENTRINDEIHGALAEIE
jgi:hypothetical protein